MDFAIIIFIYLIRSAMFINIFVYFRSRSDRRAKRRAGY